MLDSGPAIELLSSGDACNLLASYCGYHESHDVYVRPFKITFPLQTPAQFSGTIRIIAFTRKSDMADLKACSFIVCDYAPVASGKPAQARISSYHELYGAGFLQSMASKASSTTTIRRSSSQMHTGHLYLCIHTWRARNTKGLECIQDKD